MAVKIGHASIDEKGSISGGRAGDQTGREIFTRDWYKHSKGWVLLRPNDPIKADLIAEAMEKACANNHIGYDQSHRNTLYNTIKDHEFDPSTVTVDVETDCSALVRVCCAYAGIMLPDFNTSSEANTLLTSREFTKLIDSKYTTKSDYLKRGDILVTASKGHTIIILSNGDKIEESPSPVMATLSVSPSTTLEIDRTNVASIIFNFFMSKGLNIFATVGLMGNLFAESGLKPTNLQNTYEKKLGMTDDSYTKAVDDGSYKNFINDAAGYGLAQWTHWSRKEKLYNFVKEAGTSIGDLNTQLEFLWKELQGYSGVMKVLRSCTSIREASDVVLLQYEKPANSGESVQLKRAAYAQGYYDSMSKSHIEPSIQIVEEVDSSVDSSYVVKITASKLNARGGPGTNYATVSSLPNGAVCTITEESSGIGAEKWGKTDKGWISLDYVKKI